MSNPFEDFRPRQLDEKERVLFESLKMIEGVEVLPDNMREEGARILKFSNTQGITTIRIVFNDESGADLAVTNMTTLPDSAKGQGLGSVAIQKVVSWAKDNHLEYIVATQIQTQTRRFWERNGFVYDEREGNRSEDWVYKG